MAVVLVPQLSSRIVQSARQVGLKPGDSILRQPVVVTLLVESAIQNVEWQLLASAAHSSEDVDAGRVSRFGPFEERVSATTKGHGSATREGKYLHYFVI